MIKQVKKCRICESSDLTLFLPLGDIPLPNGFIEPADLKKFEKKYPLNVSFCADCGLVQLAQIVAPAEMFRNYVYIPSTSKTRMNNFDSIAQDAREQCNLNEKTLVIDIGSNDGSLLSFFKAYGIKTLGIDPATNLAKIAELKGIETVNDFVSEQLAKKIRKKYGPATVITATNVVAHIDDLYDLLSSIKILLDDTGVFICEFPYLMDLLEKNQFDTIYHEHLSYFSIKPFLHLVTKAGLSIRDIKRSPIDGGSLRVYISKIKQPGSDEKIQKLIAAENTAGLYDKKTYEKFGGRVQKLKKELIRTLKKLKQNGKHIAAYGAAAKGNIMLNYCGIDDRLIDFVVDSTPYKQGLYTPGTHIPIYPEIEITSQKPDYTLILAWNFAAEIIDKEKKYRSAGGKFIIPVPHVVIS